MKLCLSYCVLIAAIAIVPVFSHAEDAKTQISRITNDIQYLASDDLEGRGSGSEGLEVAADFIADEFKKAGLTLPEGKNSPFLEFSIRSKSSLGKPNSVTFISADGKQVELKNSEFKVCSFGTSGEIEAPLVFCGYGISSPDNNYDDFGDFDLKGKIAVIFRRVPRQTVKGGPFTSAQGVMNTRFAALGSKLQNAINRGAKAVIFLNDPTTVAQKREKLKQRIEKLKKETPDLEDVTKHRRQVEKLDQDLQSYKFDELMFFGYGGSARGNAVPTFHVQNHVFDPIFQESFGLTVSEVEAKIDETLNPMTAELKGVKAKAQATILANKTMVKNVIGVIEGEGPHADETIVIGAHYDHVGRGGPGSLLPGSTDVHNGADDNASGTVTILELARHFGAMKKPLPRRLVFMAFSAEELGLLGSKDYVNNPVYPLDKTVAMFNFDMVGRMADNKLIVFGTDTSSSWKPLLDRTAKDHTVRYVRHPYGYGPSDHSSFYGKKIPVLHFFTGLHNDYHRPTDDWPRINAQGISRIAAIASEIISETANAEQRPNYVSVRGSANPTRAGGSTPYLGTIPDLTHEGPGYLLLGVAEESPAAKAGLKAGDTITDFGGEAQMTFKSLAAELANYRKDDNVEVTYKRGDKTTTVTVKLGNPR